MTTSTTNIGKVLWQKVADECGLPEAAILISGVSDVISLEQDGHQIVLNYESVNELITTLREIKRNRPA